MASKKPAKRNVSNAKEVKKELPGKSIYYMGLKTAGFFCPTCNRNFKKGMIFEYENSTYCSRKCFPKKEVASA